MGLYDHDLVQNTCQACKVIVIEIGAKLADHPVEMKSYPEPSPKPNEYFWSPLYQIRIWCIEGTLDRRRYTQTGKLIGEFKATRFGPYLNDNYDKDYRTMTKKVIMTGLADNQWHRLSIYKPDYILHSVDPGSAENGAWVITQTFYIHDGPDGYPGRYGTAGCVEMFGPEAFSKFSNTLTSCAGASTRSDAPKMIPIWIHVVGVSRPPVVNTGH